MAILAALPLPAPLSLVKQLFFYHPGDRVGAGEYALAFLPGGRRATDITQLFDNRLYLYPERNPKETSLPTASS